MGALGLKLEIHGSGDHNALHAAATAHLRESLAKYTDPCLYGRLADYVSRARDRRFWGDDVLSWIFSDGGKASMCRMHLWKHWWSIAVALEWDELVKLSTEHGFALLNQRRPLKLHEDDSFVELRGELYLIRDHWLLSDFAPRIDISDLANPHDREQVESARLKCACGPCRALRPLARGSRPVVKPAQIATGSR